MYQKFFSVFLICFSLLTGCHSDDSYIRPHNDLVESFTSGIITRRANIQITFTEPIPEAHRSPEFLNKVFDISLRINGKFSIIDENTLYFQPEDLLDRDTRYKVSIRLDKLFGAKKDKRFEFAFKTPRPGISYENGGMDLLIEGKDTIYEMKGTLSLADWEDSITLHELIHLDKSVNLIWDKQNLGQKFDFRFRSTDDLYGKKVQLSVQRNGAGYPKQELGVIEVPDKYHFDVYSIELVKGNEEYVEVVFNRLLDPDQDFTGLVEMRPKDDVSFSVHDNRLQIWIQDKQIKERTLYLHNGIKALGGAKFQKRKSHLDHYAKKFLFVNNNPDLSFLSNENIVPYGTDMCIPFTATNLRGVIVRVIKVYENNMGQFLQQNTLNSQIGLAQVGNLLCRKVIFLDEKEGIDISKKNVFAIDLNELIQTEPGALYQLLLSYNYDLSAYPCTDARRKTKEQLLNENRVLEKEEIEQFGAANYYYQFNDQSWDNYNWEERNMPCSPSYYVDRNIQKNLLSSSLGIIAKKGDRGKFFVSVNDIKTAEPLKGIKIKVYTYQNQLIKQQSTWSNGVAEIDLQGKAPFYLIAQKGKQRGYLRLAKEDALSLSAFDVSGEEIQKGTKGYIYTERGVWRPGDSIFVSFILNDTYQDLPERHPVTCELLNPSRQVYWKRTLSTRTDNLYVFKPVTTPQAPTGTWLVRITVGGVTFEKKLRIETIKPNRLSVNLHFKKELIERAQPTDASLQVQWLTGAIANNLDYEIQATLVPVSTQFKGFEKYIFEDPARQFKAEDVLFAKGKTNAHGEASIHTTLLQGNSAPGMLKASFLTKVSEESGEASYNSIVVAYSPFRSYVGIHSPQREEKPLPTLQKNRFDLATVYANDRVAPHIPLKVSIYKVQWYWWWNSDNTQIADFISSSYNKPIKSFTLYSNNQGKAGFHLTIPEKDWGTYYIQVADLGSGHQCGLMAYFDVTDGFGHQSGMSDRANMLVFTTDKKEYQPNEKIHIRFPSTQQSHAILTIENEGGVIEHHEIDCTSDETIYTIEATEEMQPNAYISITLLNPYKSSDLPLRLYGVIPVFVNSKNARLQPVIKAPDEIRPNTNFTIIVSEKNNHPMTFTIGVVDEGLLELTNFKTPSPYEAFFAKEALDIRTWDLYNYIMGAYGGRIEQIFSIGGDDALLKGPRATANRFKPVVLFKGPFTLSKGSKVIDFRMPEYVGKVRCMVVAAHRNQFGNAQKEIWVRQPVMVLGTLPRQLAAGDECMVPVTVFAMKKGVGNVSVNLATNHLFSIIGKSVQTLRFTDMENQIVWFKIKAKEEIGKGSVSVIATAKGQKAFWNTEINIQATTLPITKVQHAIITPNQTKMFTLKPFGIVGSNKASIEVSGVQLPNLSAMMSQLDNYPYECLEQLVSRAFPKLFLPSLGQYNAAQVSQMEHQVQTVLSKIRNYMLPGGGFSYWPGSTSSDGWANIYAYQFILSAGAKGYVLPPSIRKNCGIYQSALARNWKANLNQAFTYEQVTQAYRLYVLALAQLPEKGAMNRLRECKQLAPEAKWLLAAAYAKIGKTDIAKRLIETGYSKTNVQQEWMYTMGSGLRLQAIQLITYLELGYKRQAAQMVQGIIHQIENSQGSMNTQTTTWALLALNDFYKQEPAIQGLRFELTAQGKTQLEEISKTVWTSPIVLHTHGSSFRIKNQSRGNLYVTTRLEGTADKHNQVPVSNGLHLTEKFFTSGGAPINPNLLTQGSDFIFELKVANQSGLLLRNIMVNQIVPAGWEILNTRFYQGIDKMPIGVSYQDFRDDRVLSYIPDLPVGKTLTIRIHVTASYIGTFYMIPSIGECMYNSIYQAHTAGRQIQVGR